MQSEGIVIVMTPRANTFVASDHGRGGLTDVGKTKACVPLTLGSAGKHLAIFWAKSL